MTRSIHYVQTMPDPCVLTEHIGMAWKNQYCITYRKGSHTDYYLNEGSKEKIIHAMRITAETTGMDFQDVKPTYSGMARQISEWIGSKDVIGQNSDILPAILPVWHYQKCYPAKVSQGLVLWDMTSAYWQIAIKSDTLKLYLARGGQVIPQRMSREEGLRWDKVRETVGASKPLRLSMIGVNSVGDSSKPSYSVYFRGKRIDPSGKPPTWFRPLSILTVRIAYELTQIQAEAADVVYANADAITLEECETPELWEYMGIKFREKARGAAQINSVGSYRIGETESGLFGVRRSPVVTEPAHVIPEYYKVFFPRL